MSRGRRTPGRREPTKASARRRSGPEEVLDHPLYGRVPLVREYTTLLDGTRTSSFVMVPDPRFRPHAPAGALQGDLSKQSLCSVHHLPKYFYVDEENVCAQCGEPFVFTAREQKFWYETLRFHFSSTAVRCRPCRRRRRTRRALNTQLSDAVQLVEQRPDDPVAHVTLARTTAEFFAHTNTGNLERGIAAAHRARRLAPSLHDALYWEAVCQDHAGRTDKATALYEEFVVSAGSGKRYRAMVAAARRRTREP